MNFGQIFFLTYLIDTKFSKQVYIASMWDTPFIFGIIICIPNIFAVVPGIFYFSTFPLKIVKNIECAKGKKKILNKKRCIIPKLFFSKFHVNWINNKKKNIFRIHFLKIILQGVQNLTELVT